MVCYSLCKSIRYTIRYEQKRIMWSLLKQPSLEVTSLVVASSDAECIILELTRAHGCMHVFLSATRRLNFITMYACRAFISQHCGVRCCGWAIWKYSFLEWASISSHISSFLWYYFVDHPPRNLCKSIFSSTLNALVSVRGRLGPYFCGQTQECSNFNR